MKEGARRALEALDAFRLRLDCGGVELDFPRAPSAEGFTPQLKRRRTA